MEEDVEDQAWDREDIEDFKDVATGRQAPASDRQAPASGCQAPIRPQTGATTPPSPWTRKCGFRVPAPTSMTKTGQYDMSKNLKNNPRRENEENEEKYCRAMFS